MKQNVFEFNDPVDFLNAAFQGSREANPQFSLRAWANQLGLAHSSMLSMVLAGKRTLLPNLSSKISRLYVKQGKFTDDEARYFEILTLFANAEGEDEKCFYQKILCQIRPDQEFSTLELDRLRTVSDWYHIAILEMTFLKNFNSDPRWISLRLGGSVNQGQVREAIDRLLRLGLLEKAADGRLKKTDARLATPSDRSDAGLRKFHSAMIQKASEALEKQPVEKRDITGFMLTTSMEKIPEAKRMIRDFRRKLAEFLETPNGNAVYQANVQLFEIGDENENAK